MAFTQVPVTGTIKLPNNSAPAAGAIVTFTLNTAITDGVTLISPTPVQAVCAADGTFSVTLPANDDTATTPTGTFYSVVISSAAAPFVALDTFNIIVPKADSAGVNLFALATLINPGSVSPFVSQIIAGTNVTISPTTGVGAVTINATGGGGGSVSITSPASTLNVGGTSSSPTLDVGSAVLTGHDTSVLLCGPLGILAPTGAYTLLATGTQHVGDGSATALSAVYSTLGAAQAVYSFATSLTQTVDYCAIQLAINTISGLGGGRVYIPRGSYSLNTSLAPLSSVSIYGDGPTSVLLPIGAVSALLWAGTSSNYLTDVTFRDFKIDGTGQTGGYNVGTKGIQCPWARRVVCQNVQVFNTIATGIAFDFPDGVTIDSCFCSNTGRLWTAGAAGGACIGIGVSDVASTTSQAMVVTNCHCIASGSYGIFFEAQDTFTSNLTHGIRIVGNYCEGAKMAGIGVSGSLGVTVTGNVCAANGTAGTGTNTANIALDGGTLKRLITESTIVEANTCVNGNAHGILVIGISGHAPRWCQVSNNMVYLNGGTTAQDGHGIFLNGSQSALIGISVANNTVTQNKQGGIVLASGTGHQNIAVRHNDVFSNGQTSGTTTDGIQINAPVAGLQLSGNQVYKQSGIGNQVTGINLLTGNAITNAKISGNDVRGNVTTGMAIAATVDATVIVRDNPGFNPVGVVTVAVPATTVATAASQYDQTFYVTAGASTCTCAISGGPSPVIPSGAFGTIRVPAGQTLTPTYTSAPTWVVEAE